MNYKDELDRAGYAVRDKVGKVLSSGSEIMTLRDRAAEFRATNNPQVNATADAVFAKASGLLSNYRSVEADSVKLLGEAAAMRSKMDTDPLWKSIQAGETSAFGWESLNRMKDYIGEAVSLTQRLLALSARADAHLKSVEALRKDQAALENFAQGKGIRAAVTGLGSFAGGYFGMVKVVAIGAGVVAAAYALGPMLRKRA